LYRASACVSYLPLKIEVTHLFLNIEVRALSQTLNNQLVALSPLVDVLDVI
jgi:hypothetical protein